MTLKLIIKFYHPEEIEKITGNQEKEIIELYLKNEKTLRVISEQFDCSIAMILKILRRNNIKIEPRII